MIYIVTAENRYLFGADLSVMHRHREQIFVDGLGWPIHTIDNEDIDAYDGEQTLYLLTRTMPAAPIAAFARVLPTHYEGQDPAVALTTDSRTFATVDALPPAIADALRSYYAANDD